MLFFLPSAVASVFTRYSTLSFFLSLSRNIFLRWGASFERQIFLGERRRKILTTRIFISFSACLPWRVNTILTISVPPFFLYDQKTRQHRGAVHVEPKRISQRSVISTPPPNFLPRCRSRILLAPFSRFRLSSITEPARRHAVKRG